MLYVQITQSRAGGAVNYSSLSDIFFNQSVINKCASHLDQRYKGCDPLSTPKVFNLDTQLLSQIGNDNSFSQHFGGSSGSIDDDQVSLAPSDSISNLG